MVIRVLVGIIIINLLFLWVMVRYGNNKEKRNNN